MNETSRGHVAVIFMSVRTVADDAGYTEAAAAMEALAAKQPGYLGIESTRGPDRFGITVSFWEDEAAAIRWRDQPDHAAIRDRGRAIWYESCRTIVTHVERDYRWTKKGPVREDQP
jgi:heme-degrading monooxygenase HmoA